MADETTELPEPSPQGQDAPPDTLVEVSDEKASTDVQTSFTEEA